MNVNDLLQSKYLGKSDLDSAGKNYTIDSLEVVTVGLDNEDKPCLYFTQGKPMLVNKTNLRTLMAMFGPDSLAWKGKQINVFNDVTVHYQGNVGGLRVRPVQATQADYAAVRSGEMSGADQDVPF
jgi:hypothetical protein